MSILRASQQHGEVVPSTQADAFSVAAITEAARKKLSPLTHREDHTFHDAHNQFYQTSNLRPLLRAAELSLEDLLRNESAWIGQVYQDTRSKMERLALKLEDGGYLALHCIHPCEPGESFYHFHQWPASIHVLEGGYKMGVGSGADDNAPPPVDLTIDVQPGTVYDMPNRDSWHFVETQEPSYSVIVMGQNWQRAPLVTKYTLPLVPQSLEQSRRKHLVDTFRVFAQEFRTGMRRVADFLRR